MLPVPVLRAPGFQRSCVPGMHVVQKACCREGMANLGSRTRVYHRAARTDLTVLRKRSLSNVIPAPRRLCGGQVRAMVLGKNGEVIGKIGIAARAQLQEYLQNAVGVHLIVNVKVDRNEKSRR